MNKKEELIKEYKKLDSIVIKLHRLMLDGIVSQEDISHITYLLEEGMIKIRRKIKEATK